MMKHHRIKIVSRAISLACGLTAMSAFAGHWDGAWYVSNDGTGRYNPTTNQSEYYSGGMWNPDAHPETNPANMEYKSDGADRGSTASSYVTVTVGNSENNRRRYYSTNYYVGMYSGQNNSHNSSPSPQKSSALPGWDLYFGADAAYDRNEVSLDDARDINRESRASAFTLTLAGRNDRALFMAAFRYSQIRGLNRFEDTDTDLLTFSIMPGYRLLNQNENGLNVDAFGALDLSYVDTTGVDSQTRLAPGLGIAATRSTGVGIFHAIYSFSCDRNLNGDIEVTGNKYINSHGVNLGVTLPLASHVTLTPAVDYTYVFDLPDPVQNDFTSAMLDLRLVGFDPWSAAVGARQSLDTSGDYGINLSVTYKW